MAELVAKRWAKALIELTKENEEISKDEVLRNLRNVSETISGSEELSQVLNNPSISTEEKQIVLSKVFQNNTMPIVYNFVFALNLKKRIGLIDDIVEEFVKELEEFENIVNVDITSAIEISEEKKADIKNRISEKLHKNVNTRWDVDSDIIGGLTFNINDVVVDNSIKHKLDNLSKNIIRN